MDIALLQETHLLKADTGSIANRFYHTRAFSSADSKSRCNLRTKVLSSWADAIGLLLLVWNLMQER